MDVTWGLGIPSYVPQKVNILYVDHDCTYDSLLKDMFASFSCEVTIVKLASTALEMLAEGTFLFDLVMEDIHSPDECGFKLLRDATRMDLPVILLTDGDDPSIIMRGIEEGAIFCIQKPVTMELVSCLWQHILREKIRKIKDDEKLRGLMTHYEFQSGSMNERNNIGQYSKSVKEVRNQINSAIDDGVTVEKHNVVRPKKKDWIEWTPDLHGKFMNAVIQLGEGRCYPKEILELMNVPGLTRMQVASHLQKCRYGDWQVNHQRRLYPDYDPKMTPPDFRVPPKRQRRFGTMPRLESIPKLGFNVQQNSSKTVDEVHNAGDQANMNKQVRPLQGFVKAGDDIEIEGSMPIGLPSNQMFIPDEQLVFDAHSSTNPNSSTNKEVYGNGQLQELAAMDNQKHTGQKKPPVKGVMKHEDKDVLVMERQVVRAMKLVGLYLCMLERHSNPKYLD